MSLAVLIIEDEEVLGRNMLHYLQRAGFEAQLAVTAIEGVALYEQVRPDIVVLDYHLPDVTDMLLHIEAAHLPEQSVSNAHLSLSPWMHFARVAAQDVAELPGEEVQFLGGEFEPRQAGNARDVFASESGHTS